MQFCLRLLALGFLVLPLVACPATAPTECKSKDECVSGQVCCKENTDDATGTCKVESECTNKPPACTGTACKSKDDCSGKETCIEGCCKDSGGGQDCQKHLDCPKGNDCVPDGEKKTCQACATTCATDLDCSGGGEKCENGCCRLPSCTKDDDCAGRDGKPRCKVETGECIACLKSEDCQKADEQSICRNERCAKVECTADRHCLDNNKPTCNTESYRCVERPVCVSDNDCIDPQLSRCDPNADGGKGKCKKGSCEPCSTDDECGGAGDFCVGADRGLKDGKRCLRACETDKDCPGGFTCSDKVVNGFKVCFPRIEFCVDPCTKITCKPEETCVAGVCKPKPAPCNVCTEEDKSNCEAGADCIPYPGAGSFCGRKCSTKADCPDDSAREYQCLNGQCTASKGCE